MNTTALTVADLLRERAAAEPGAVALRVGDTGALTLGQWEDRSNGMARGLVRRGIGRGQRVALLFDNEHWADYAVSYLGVVKAGAVAVPLGSRFAGPEVAQILGHAGASGVVCAEELRPPATEAWVSEVAELAEEPPVDRFQVPVGDDDLAEILYTSGTTGRPKGVACSHRSVMAHDVPPDARAETPDQPVSFLHCFPIGTQAGQETLRVPLRIGGRVAVALPHFDPEQLCSLVAEHRIARLQLVPAMAQLLVASGAHRGHDVSSVERVILSSAHAPPALFLRLAELFPKASLWNAYALTEAGSARTLMRWDQGRPTAVGLPVGRTEIRIADDLGQGLGAGVAGEVWLRREGTPTRQYYRDSVASTEVFVGDWVRTGDIGHLDADGYLHLDDRKKDLIISGGSNISSVEVEDVLCEHPAVVEAAVFGVPHPVLGEDVAAAVVVSSPVPERALTDFVRARLAEHKVPHRLVLVDQLPCNASGKVLKSELRRRFGAAGASGALGADGAVGVAGEGSAVFVAPRGPTETAMAGVWQQVLALPRVGAHDDFFALGGHSLAAAQIAARLRDLFGVDVGPGALFEAPTVAELARSVDRQLGQRPVTGAAPGPQPGPPPASPAYGTVSPDRR